TLDEARLFQPLAECTHAACITVGRCAVEETDHRQCRLLRARREGPCGDAAEQRDERAPVHSITSLARQRGPYLPSFQISAASFQSLPIFSHTTRYLPVTSCGVGPLVLRLKVPISRAAEGPSGFTSRVVNFGSLTCSAIFFHSTSIAALPLTMPEPGGNAVASSV